MKFLKRYLDKDEWNEIDIEKEKELWKNRGNFVSVKQAEKDLIEHGHLRTDVAYYISVEEE